MKREDGYYWIKRPLTNKNDPMTDNGWEVACFEKGEGWYSIWDGGAYHDEEVEEIDERRVVREEAQGTKKGYALSEFMSHRMYAKAYVGCQVVDGKPGRQTAYLRNSNDYDIKPIAVWKIVGWENNGDPTWEKVDKQQ